MVVFYINKNLIDYSSAECPTVVKTVCTLFPCELLETPFKPLYLYLPTNVNGLPASWNLSR